MQTIDNFNFEGKKAIIRVDFNVPLNENFEITDDTRIRAALPTIKKVIDEKGSVILMSHLGRPKDGPEDKFSLKHILNHLSNKLGVEVQFASDCIGAEAEEKAAALKAGEVLVLENLRFHKEEKKGDEAFAKKLADLADVYVNDAFGTAHRAHASTAVIAQYFTDETKMFGYVINGELTSVDKVIESSEKPFTAIMGGAKVSSKITIIENMLDKVDNMIITGGMIFTFAKAAGGNIGSSLCEDDKLDLAKSIVEKAKAKGVKLLIATDAVVADKFTNDANTQIVPFDKVPDGWMGLDVGPDTVKDYVEVIKNSKTILWNGPTGVFEMENFSKGSKAVAEAIAEATTNGAFSLIGGGDSVACINKFGLAKKVSYVSTGGGALLEYIEGKDLPGIKAIRG